MKMNHLYTYIKSDVFLMEHIQSFKIHTFLALLKVRKKKFVTLPDGFLPVGLNYFPFSLTQFLGLSTKSKTRSMIWMIQSFGNVGMWPHRIRKSWKRILPCVVICWNVQIQHRSWPLEGHCQLSCVLCEFCQPIASVEQWDGKTTLY